MSFNGKLIGIDIGAKNIKLVEIKNGKKKIVLKKLKINTPVGVIKDGEILDPQLVGGTLGTLFEKNNIKNKNISVCVKSSQAIVRELALPFMPPKEIEPAVEFQLSQTFPGITQTHTIGYRIYKRNEADGIRGIVTFCPNKILTSYVETLKVTGYNLGYIDISSNCITKAYKAFADNSDIYKNIIIVDIGYISSTVNLIVNSNLVLSRYVEGGSKSIDSLISSNFNLSLEEAEMVKENTHESVKIKENEINSYIRLGIIAIEEQVKHTIDFFAYSNPDSKIDKIILTGCGSMLSDLIPYLNTEFEVPVDIIKPNDLYGTENDDLIEFLPAIGTAIREE